MLIYTKNMNQFATYWAPGGNDGFGGMSFASVSLIPCRWQDDAVEFRDASGQDLTSSAIVYVGAQVVTRGYLALGDQTATADPRGFAGAYEIRQVGQSPSLDGSKVLVKAFL